MKQETKPLYKELNGLRHKGPFKIEYQQYEDGTHICLADDDGNWIADFGNEGDSIGESSARYTALALNNLHILAEALENAILSQEDIFNKNKEAADWYNNNMPGVGQKLDYKSYEPLPQWVIKAKEALNRIS